LPGKNPTPLEKQLVDRIVACWLALQHAEMMAASTAEGDLNHQESYQKRLDAAERRYQAGINQLNKVRELLPKKETRPVKVVGGSKKPARTNGKSAKGKSNGQNTVKNRMSVLFAERELVGTGQN
jgi:hypothetical protein